jgi:uncharacterized protein
MYKESSRQEKQATTKKEEMELFKEYIKDRWQGKIPLARLFKTSDNCYLYDTGTNKILDCSEVVFDMLERLFTMDIDRAVDDFNQKYDHDMDFFIHAADNIKAAIETEKVLITMEARGFEKSGHFTNFEESIDSRLEILLLEVTEQCNLRCGYCVYNEPVTDKRDHGRKDMSLETAYKAIDYLNAHSYNREDVTIGFYGGEPLLRFPFLKSVLEYAKFVIKDRELYFTLTTNGVMLTPEIAGFLADNNMRVLLSIDGPQEIHDLYRVDVGGKGTFSRAVQGLNNLAEAYGDTAKDKISFSIVYAPPFSERKLDSIAKHLEEMPWFPEGLSVTISYPSRGSVPIDRFPEGIPSEDKSLREWAYERFLESYTGIGEVDSLAKSVIEKPLALLMNRSVLKEPLDHYFLNGCCIPGVRRLYVSTEGKFHVCERVNTTAPTIGDVDSGIDIEAIKKIYIEGYDKLSRPVCSKCWVARMCSACYIDVFDDKKLDLDTKLKTCANVKITSEETLKFYCSLLELKPEGLDYLSDYDLK